MLKGKIPSTLCMKVKDELLIFNTSLRPEKCNIIKSFICPRHRKLC